MSTFDFGNGPVPAHQHPNGGGWVADSALVSDSARVSGNAWVSDSAQVSGNAWVSGNARVSGNAWVSGNARVTGVSRSDGYTFCALPCADGQVRVIAGCRYFTFDEARKHWRATRAGTPLGDETFAILDYLEAMVKIRGYV